MAIIGTLPNNIQNGQTVDATPLMADLNFIVNQVNANAFPIGAIPTGAFLNIQVFTSGVNTYTPNPNAKRAIVHVIGGGGGGGAGPITGAGQVGIGAGGAGGAYGVGIISLPVATTVTIGGGGVGGISGANPAVSAGQPGGTTSFGTLIIAPGGTGGVAAGPSAPPFVPIVTPAAGFAHGTATNILSTGGNPSEIAWVNSLTSFLGSNGGIGPFGGAGAAGAQGGGGNPGIGPGSGGGGAANLPSATGANGGQGANGLVIVYEFV